MKTFFTFLYEQRGGIFVLLACLAFAAALVRYIASIFCLGRFAAAPSAPSATTGAPSLGVKDGRISFMAAEFFANLINDFRHLLALILVLIFAFVLGYAMWISQGDAEELTKAIQGVTATLGGLIGTIMGYYFGESAATKSQGPPQTVASAGAPVQSSGSGGSSEPAAPVKPAAKQPPAG